MNNFESCRRKRSLSADNFNVNEGPSSGLTTELEIVNNDDIAFALRYGPPKKKRKLMELINNLNEYSFSIRQRSARKSKEATGSITNSSRPFIKRVEREKISLYEITSDRNAKKNYCDGKGHIYSVNSRKKGVIYLLCKNAKRFSCDGRVNVKDGNWDEAEITKKHSHPPDQKRLDYIKFQKKLEEIIRENPFIKPSSAYNKAKIAFKNEINRRNIPVLSKFNTFIHRITKEHIPLHPRTIDEFEQLINEAKTFQRFGTDARGQTLYRGVLRGRSGSNILFVSESVLKKVKKKRRVKFLSDGTFKALPHHLKFRQLYIINVIIRKRSYPLAYVLMESKDCNSYELVFHKIKSMIGTTRVHLGMTDYEASTRKAFKHVFPKARLAGCYFHYVQAISKAFKRYGMKKDPKFNSTRQKVSALALLPNDFILKGFAEISKKFKGSKRWARFREYWLKQWHGPSKRKNANISVYGLRHRTNNFSETLNRTLNSLGKHPNIWELISNIQTIDMNKSDELDNVKDGLILTTPKSTEMKNLNEKIKNATTEFEKHQNVGRFLKEVTFNENLEMHYKERIHIDGVDTDNESDNDDEYDETIIPNSFRRKSNYQRIPRGGKKSV